MNDLTNILRFVCDSHFEASGIGSSDGGKQKDQEEEGKHTGGHPEIKTSNTRRRHRQHLTCSVSTALSLEGLIKTLRVLSLTKSLVSFIYPE